MSSALDWHPEPTVIVAGDGTGFEAAALALVASLGYDADVVPEDELDRYRPHLVIVRDEFALTRTLRTQVKRQARFAVLMSPTRETQRSDSRRILWLSGRSAAEDLGRLLHSVAERGETSSCAVHMTFRERQVVGDYVLGANVPQVARRHHIAESTVKAHYQRVSARYAEAGRPVKNKTQLLLEMIADGRIDLPRREP